MSRKTDSLSFLCLRGKARGLFSVDIRHSLFGWGFQGERPAAPDADGLPEGAAA